MGISGLTTFMDDNLKLIKEFPLHDTKVVIDGNNLYHLIFYNNHVDFLHGGDYDQYARKIKEFFSLLSSCNIQPYVVFDGGYEQDDKKFQTILKRVQQRLEMAMLLAKGQRGKVMPILAYDTFRAVLLEIKVPFAVCDFEADKEIGILANQFDCPVLSYDSDFYILPLSAGFIPFDSVNFTLQEGRREDDSVYHYLPARRYHVDNFVKFFPSLGREVLPLLATLLGNDYVDIRIFHAFYSSVRSHENIKTQFRIPKTHTKMQKVISWLESLENYNEGIEKIMSTALTPIQKETISVAIRKTLEAFTANASDTEFSLHSYFMENENSEGKLHCIGNPIKGYNGSIIPSWYACLHRQGFLPPSSLDVITLHRKFLLPQVEGPKTTSSYHCSVKLRECMYGILLSEDIAVLGKTEEMAPNRKCAVEEYDRNIYQLKKNIVCPEIMLEGYGSLPKLSDIPELSPSDKENIVRLVLDIPSFGLDNMTEDLEFVLGIVLFWIKNADPKVTVYHLKTVLVCLLMLKVKWVLIHHGATGCEENMIETAVLSMPTVNIKEVRTKLHPYSARPEHSRKHPVDSDLIHSFAQLQTCILAAMHLNFLLLCPFPSPSVSHIFSGTFLYNFCLELQKRRSPDMFINELLSKDSNLQQVYQCLLDAVMNVLDPEGLTEESKYKKRSKAHKCKSKKDKNTEQSASSPENVKPEVKKKHKTTTQYVANCPLTNRFAFLDMSGESLDESDEDEEMKDELSV